MSQDKSPDFASLLEYLRRTRGFDFSGYKLSSLMRRMRKRMGEVGIESYSVYQDYLEVHPDEFGPLFNTVLINVTSFFRDAEAWKFLAEGVIPRLLEEKPAGVIRVWSAGCASGQEAYTVAMLLAEALGEEGFRQRVKIYATDADEEALSQARQASYDDHQVAEIPPALLAKYFETVHERHAFRADLRRCLIFGRHDLVQDAAISRIDLLLCRNTLMYFNVDTQAKILARLHFALTPAGYLFLGKAETLLSRSSSFRPVDLKRRVFQRTGNANLREQLLAAAPQGPAEGSHRLTRLRDAALEHSPVALLVVDRKGHLVLASERVRQIFHLSRSDLGRLLQDLEISYRPVELRSLLDEAYATRSVVRVGDVAWQRGMGETFQLELQVAPVIDANDGVLGALISFLDFTQSKDLKREMERAHQALETAYEELQSANEELETTNEELQSTIEELETTNEELQSANEELETMNEELQSTNEELRTMNDQLHQRSDEVNTLNSLLETILGSLEVGVALLDRDLAVEVWSRHAEELWGLRSEETLGRSLLQLDIGIPIADLKQPLADCMQGNEDGHRLILDGVNRRGKPIRCRIHCTRLESRDGDSRQILVLMEESARRPGPEPPRTGDERS